MKSNRWAYVTAAAGLVAGMLVLGSSEGTAQPQAAKPATVWEYKTLYVGGGDPVPAFNEAGQQGWELVTSRAYGVENQSLTTYVFKRAK